MSSVTLSEFPLYLAHPTYLWNNSSLIWNLPSVIWNASSVNTIHVPKKGELECVWHTMLQKFKDPLKRETLTVPCPGKGVCTDPRSGDATFGVGGPGPPVTDNWSQLNLDRGREKT